MSESPIENKTQTLLPSSTYYKKNNDTNNAGGNTGKPRRTEDGMQIPLVTAKAHF